MGDSCFTSVDFTTSCVEILFAVVNVAGSILHRLALGVSQVHGGGACVCVNSTEVKHESPTNQVVFFFFWDKFFVYK